MLGPLAPVTRDYCGDRRSSPTSQFPSCLSRIVRAAEADTEMVTPHDTDELKQLAASRPLKWDLKDPLKKEPWLLTVEAELQVDPEVWTAVTQGPPTIDRLIARSPKPMTRTKAAAVAGLLAGPYRDASQKGYKKILNLIDFRNNAPFAAKVRRKAGPEMEGHELWKLVQEKIDETS